LGYWQKPPVHVPLRHALLVAQVPPACPFGVQVPVAAGGTPRQKPHVEQSASLVQLLHESLLLHEPEHEMLRLWQVPEPSQMLPFCVLPEQWNPFGVPHFV